MRRAIFEVKRYCLNNVGAKFIPSLGFRKDGMAQGTRAVATFLPVAYFEDKLHAHRLPEAGRHGISEPPLYGRLNRNVPEAGFRAPLDASNFI